VIADHAAKPGADIAVGKTLHRIDESVLRREVEAAGFKLIALVISGATRRPPRFQLAETDRAGRCVRSEVPEPM